MIEPGLHPVVLDRTQLFYSGSCLPPLICHCSTTLRRPTGDHGRKLKVKTPPPISISVCLSKHIITLLSLSCTIHDIEIKLFVYIINSQIIENENCVLTWSTPIITPYDAIFSKLVVSNLSSSLCNWFRLIPNWLRPVWQVHYYYLFIAEKKWCLVFFYQF